jgi:predicted DNA-binding transcriptional regulator AlpA
MERNEGEGFMRVASKNERTATVKVTRSPERWLGPIQDTDRLMTMAEVSDLLCIPISTLYGGATAVRGRPVTASGRHVRYRRAAVEAWIETQADHRPVL